MVFDLNHYQNVYLPRSSCIYLGLINTTVLFVIGVPPHPMCDRLLLILGEMYLVNQAIHEFLQLALTTDLPNLNLNPTYNTSRNAITIRNNNTFSTLTIGTYQPDAVAGHDLHNNPWLMQLQLH
jgi:hypothetical protein